MAESETFDFDDITVYPTDGYDSSRRSPAGRAGAADDHGGDQSYHDPSDTDAFDRIIDDLAAGCTGRHQARSTQPAPSGASTGPAPQTWNLETDGAVSTGPGRPGRRRDRGRALRRLVLPRPRRSTRVLSVCLLILLFALSALAGIAAHGIRTLAAGLRRERVRAAVVERPLSADHLLLDEQGFAAVLDQRPEDAARLYHRRGVLLAQRERHLAALEAHRAAIQHSAHAVPVAWQLDRVDVLLALGRLDAAMAVLRGLDLERLDPEQRAAVIGLRGRLHLAHER
ncbi:MAG: hypothetical protein ACOCYP_08000 [Planctomycetota bacterium]